MRSLGNGVVGFLVQILRRTSPALQKKRSILKSVGIAVGICAVSLTPAFAEDFSAEAPDEASQVWFDVENASSSLSDAYIQVGETDAEYIELCSNFYGVSAKMNSGFDGARKLTVFASTDGTADLIVTFAKPDGTVLKVQHASVTVEKTTGSREFLSCMGAESASNDVPDDQTPTETPTPSPTAPPTGSPSPSPSEPTPSDGVTPTASPSSDSTPQPSASANDGVDKQTTGQSDSGQGSGGLASTGTIAGILFAVAIGSGALGLVAFRLRRAVNR